MFLRKLLYTDPRDTKLHFKNRPPGKNLSKPNVSSCDMQVFISKHGPVGKLFISIYFTPAFLMMVAAEELNVV